MRYFFRWASLMLKERNLSEMKLMRNLIEMSEMKLMRNLSEMKLIKEELLRLKLNRPKKHDAGSLPGSPPKKRYEHTEFHTFPFAIGALSAWQGERRIGLT